MAYIGSESEEEEDRVATEDERGQRVPRPQPGAEGHEQQQRRAAILNGFRDATARLFVEPARSPPQRIELAHGQHQQKGRPAEQAPVDHDVALCHFSHWLGVL